MAGPLGIIAGGGDLPRRLVDACAAQDRPVFLIALEGQIDPAEIPDGTPHIWIRMGAAGTILERLRAQGVTDVVMAGRVRRPSLAELRPDWKAAQLFARIGAKALGDDGILRAVAGVLEAEGFHVVGVQDVVSDLLTPAGVHTRMTPDEEDMASIARGIDAARTLGRLDIGQSVVVQQGMILGVEAAEGTDALVGRCGDLKREGRGPILVKMRKPTQDHRLDLPAIGPETVARARAAGFRGIAAEAGGTLLLTRDRTIEMADEAGLFLVGIGASGA